MKHSVALATVICLSAAIGGCPFNSSTDESPVKAVIGVTTTAGDAPLLIVVTAASSYSTNGLIVEYHWDFAGEATSDLAAAEHTFVDPGRYAVTLTVVDEAGEQATTKTYVRVRGGPVTARIAADKVSGAAPLTVQFDGTTSTAEDDTILDYYWEFGDGTTSRAATPSHTYTGAGTFIVNLRAISAGGVEGTAQATVTVGAGAASGSLQFNGVQYANLPVVVDAARTAFTFEIWMNPDAEGGTVATFGAPNVSVSVSPGVGVTIRSGSDTYNISAPVLTNQWQHLAASYADGAGAKVYLDGVATGTAALTGDFTFTVLSLGAGYRGKLADARFWTAARTVAEITADMNGAVSGSATGLAGAWSLGEGTGQALGNSAAGGEDGTRGPSSAEEAADPAWSSDNPQAERGKPRIPSPKRKRVSTRRTSTLDPTTTAALDPKRPGSKAVQCPKIKARAVVSPAIVLPTGALCERGRASLPKNGGS